MNTRALQTGRSPHRTSLFILMLLTAVYVLFFDLGERGFENKDTARYAEIVWEMQQSGDYLVPRFNGVIFTEKPILLIWLIALFSNISGAISPFAARLPSALSALGCVLIVYSLGKRLFGPRGGILAGFILCTSFGFAWEARATRTDMLLTLFVTSSLYFLYRGFNDGKNAGRSFLAAYVAAGLAALTKGPIGIALPAAAFFLYLVWRRRLRLIPRMRLGWGILIIVAIQAAWYVPFLVRIGPEGRSFFYEMYVYKENLLSFTTGFDHYEPPWFYIPDLLSHFLPWSPFLLPYFLLLSSRRFRESGRDHRFAASWFIGIFAFLTLSSGKDSRYALPLYPAAALLTAHLWDRLIDRESLPLSRPIVLIFSILTTAAAVAFPFAARVLAPPLFSFSFAASAGLLLLVVALLRAPAPQKATLIFAVIVYAFTCGWSSYIGNLPAHETERARQRRLAEQVAPVVGGVPLATYGPTDDRFGRRMALGLFLGRPVNFIDRPSKLLDYLLSEEPVFCLMREKVYARLHRRARFRKVMRPVGRYRYHSLDLVLVTNKSAPSGR